MLNIFFFLSIVFLLTFIIGHWLEKIRIPWVFGSLVLGIFLALYNPFADITSSHTFEFLAQLGMYFLLFVIGLEINIQQIKKKVGFIFKTAFLLVLFETIAGSIIVHYIFGYSWAISFLVALSFGSVGTAILYPLLDQFKVVKTKLGQAIIGIGSLNDLLEIMIFVLISALISTQLHTGASVALVLISLLALFILTIGFTQLKRKGLKFSFLNIEPLFLFSLFALFLFLGIGTMTELAPLAALLAGISLKAFIPKERFNLIDKEIKTMCYGFFAPLFFLGVCLSLDMSYLIAYPLLIILIVLVSKGIKILGSYLLARKELGAKQSILLGIGLSIRFSTSIVIIKLLFENGLVGVDLYSMIVASIIIFKFVTSPLFTNLLVKWKVARRLRI